MFIKFQIFIENSQHIGHLTDDIMNQLDDDTEAQLVRRKKRRSGSLNRKLTSNIFQVVYVRNNL